MSDFIDYVDFCANTPEGVFTSRVRTASRVGFDNSCIKPITSLPYSWQVSLAAKWVKELRESGDGSVYDYLDDKTADMHDCLFDEDWRMSATQEEIDLYIKTVEGILLKNLLQKPLFIESYEEAVTQAYFDRAESARIEANGWKKDAWLGQRIIMGGIGYA